MTDEELRILVEFVLVSSGAKVKVLVMRKVNRYSFYRDIQL